MIIYKKKTLIYKIWKWKLIFPFIKFVFFVIDIVLRFLVLR